MRQQQSTMTHDPATGDAKPYPSHAQQWRDYHGRFAAWLFNPWTGERRRAEDVGADVQGHLMLPPGEPVYADYGAGAPARGTLAHDLLALEDTGHAAAVAAANATVDSVTGKGVGKPLPPIAGNAVRTAHARSKPAARKPSRPSRKAKR
jgi:hypothetical protein